MKNIHRVYSLLLLMCGFFMQLKADYPWSSEQEREIMAYANAYRASHGDPQAFHTITDFSCKEYSHEEGLKILELVKQVFSRDANISAVNYWCGENADDDIDAQIVMRAFECFFKGVLVGAGPSLVHQKYTDLRYILYGKVGGILHSTEEEFTKEEYNSAIIKLLQVFERVVEKAKVPLYITIFKGGFMLGYTGLWYKVLFLGGIPPSLVDASH